MVLNDSCAHQERLASAVGTAALSWPCGGREPSARALVRDGQTDGSVQSDTCYGYKLRTLWEPQTVISEGSEWFNSGYLEVRQPTVLLVQASRQIGIHVC